MSKPGRRRSGFLAMLMALGLAACSSSDSSNTANNTADIDVVADDPAGNVGPIVAEPVPPQRYTLEEAASRGLVSYEIAGRNGSSGAALTLKIRRLVAEPIEVYVPPGTVFQTGSSGVQSMVARSIVKEIAEEVAEEIAKKALEESGVVELIDDAVHNFLIEAYCRDFELDNPSPQDGFTAGSVDGHAAALLEAAHYRGLGLEATQAAIWMDRGVTPEHISEKFDATPEDFEAAASLLAALSPPAPTSESGNTM
jgi:hypothetical protein